MLAWLVACYVGVLACGSVGAQTAPAFQWAVSGGAADNETVAGVATDAAGNVYVVGTFTNTTTFGVSSFTSAGGSDIFLAKYASNGVMQWVRQFGGTGNDVARAITANPVGGVFIVGSFETTADFGATTLTSAGGADAFVARMETTAGIVIWAASAGGAGEDRAVGIHGGFNLGVVGEFNGTATFGGATGGPTTTLTSAGAQDVFGWAVRDSSGAFLSAIGLGGAGDETAATASSASGSFPVLLGGGFTGTMVVSNVFSQGIILTSAGGSDGFAVTWDPFGNRFLGVTQIGGPDDDAVQVVASSGGQHYVAGRFGSTATIYLAGGTSLFPTGGFTNTSGSGSDVFFLSYQGTFLSTYLPSAVVGGPGNDSASGIAVGVGAQPESYLVGTFSGSTTVFGLTNFAPIPLIGTGQQDIFVAKLSSFGRPLWARALGGSGNESAPAAAIYFSGASLPLIIAGAYENSLTLGLTALNAVGGSDVFVTSIEADPRIVTQPQSVAVPFGGTASFSVVAGGTGPFSYRWSHNIPAIGTNPSTTITLANQTNSNLVINNVGAANLGTYFVQVTGTFGGIGSVGATLSFSQGFGISTQPLSRTVTRGSTATFTVGVSGTGPFFFQWRHDGTNIPGAVSTSLGVANARTTDQGIYDVLVSDGLTTIPSFGAALFVNSPPFITAEPLSQILPPGTNVTLSLVFEGSGPLAFQWRRNGVVLPGATEPTLTLTNLSAAQAGAYSVTISNVFASVISGTALITVGIPPVINTQPLGQAAPIGTNILLSVGATGVAPLTYQWFFAGLPITGAVGPTLALTNPQAANSGTYHAQVSDGTITINSSNALVRVFTPFTLAPPRFTNNSSFSFSLGGDSGQYYRLEFSTNLTTWLPLATNLAIAGEAAFSDTSISNQPGRFYRVILLP